MTMMGNNEWLRSAGERSMRAMLMTVESLAALVPEPLDAEDTEHLHWCWECINYIAQSRLATAQLAAHKAANAPSDMDRLVEMMRGLDAKLDAKLAGMMGTANGAAPETAAVK